MVLQLQSNEGHGAVDGPYRVRRVLEGVMNASEVVFITELISRTSKRLVRE